MATSPERSIAQMVSTMTTHKRSLSSKKMKQQGFALLETLIAIVVLMIGLLAVLAS
jgi:competence protein ComGF